jgi:uncharacterized protein YfiM (DUF2279 family)
VTWALLVALALWPDPPQPSVVVGPRPPAPQAVALRPLRPSSRFTHLAGAASPPLPTALLAMAPLAVTKPPTPAPVADGWFARDKWMHFAASAVVHAVFYGGALGSNAHAASQRIGGAAVAVIGLGREVYDWRVKDRFSNKDLVWDALGGVAAAVAVHQVR